MLSFRLSQFQRPLRTAPRPLHLQQPNYANLFDDDTLIYDAFYKDHQLVIITPPLTKADWNFIFSNIKINHRKLNRHFFSPIQLYQSPRIDKAIIKIDAEIIHLFNRLISPNTIKLPLKCRNVLYTMQKNNKIEWINDWIDWHVKNHDVQAVIIYDNHSDHYSLNELIQKTKRQDDVQILIVFCPFKHGPSKWQGGKDDSTYLQTAMLEHVRYKYCNLNTRLLQCDIDELIFANQQQSIFDVCQEKSAISIFSGHWVELPEHKNPDNAKHFDHEYIDVSRHCPNKWLANLKYLQDAQFLNIHGLYGNKKSELTLTQAKYLHFRCISTHWKYTRNFSKSFQDEKFKMINWLQPDTIFHSIF